MFKPNDLPEILFSSSNPQGSRQLGSLLKEGLIRKIDGRIYTSNLEEEEAVIVHRNLFYIVGQLYPNAVLSYRSALEVRPTDKDNIYLTYSYTDTIKLAGIHLKLIKGSGPLEADHKMNGELYLASLERACLENLKASRKGKDGERRALEASVIEERLLDILRIDGEEGLNIFRDRARAIAEELDFAKAFQKLNQKIGALLSTKPSKVLHSPQAIAASLGVPYDAFRVDLFWKLFAALKEQRFLYRTEQSASNEAFQNFAFFEAYFSNYIEGTEFRLEEAKEIVFEGRMIENRTGDSHDMKGTYELVSNPFELRKSPETYETLLNILQGRHAVIMRGRPDKRPGQFKQRSNRAGDTLFVEPALVRGTLKQAFEPYQALAHPLARAIFMMFIISEIHPFEDGNGRIARVMMNAELVQGNLTKIIIPTVYREDYILALRKLTRQQIPAAYIKMMDTAQGYSHALQLDDFEVLLQQLKGTNAFLEPEEGRLVLGEQ